MRQSFCALLLGAAASVLLYAPALHAQGADALTARVPFTFRAGHALLPPGQYDLQFDPASLDGVLRLYSNDGREEAYVLTVNGRVPHGTGDQPTLVFEKDGNRYSLVAVRDPEAAFSLRVVGAHRALSEESPAGPGA